MAKTRKEQLEELLREDPDDPFLRYGLAMEQVSAGDDEGAAARFRELMAAAPGYVPAYLQAGQALVRLGREDEARAVLRAGLTAAQKAGDAHAHGEMAGLLDSIQ